MSRQKSPITIIGAGIIGLACAWEMARRGASVTVYDKDEPGRGASWAAAGMLAPVAEAEHDQNWFDLCAHSNHLWKTFAEELTAETGIRVDYHAGPSLIVARDQEEAIGLQRMAHVMADLLADFRVLDVAAARKSVPLVSEDIEGACLMPSDGWVDTRKVVAALADACNANGVQFKRRQVQELDSFLEQGPVLVAAGAGAGQLTGLPVEAIEGVMLAYDRADLPLDQVIRAGSEYAVPRETVTLFGATVGEVEDPEGYLMRRAVELFPSLAGVQTVDSWTGYRPKLPDRFPAFGLLPDGVYVAAGHHRNGILLAPVTARIMADTILGGEQRALSPAFSPNRFAAATP